VWAEPSDLVPTCRDFLGLGVGEDVVCLPDILSGLYVGRLFGCNDGVVGGYSLEGICR